MKMVDFYCMSTGGETALMQFYSYTQDILKSKYVARCALPPLPHYQMRRGIICYPDCPLPLVQIMELVAEWHGVPTARNSSDWAYPTRVQMGQSAFQFLIPDDLDFLGKSISQQPCQRSEQELWAWLHSHYGGHRVAEQMGHVGGFILTFVAVTRSNGYDLEWIGTLPHLLRT
jgi:hypothetical protein